MLKLQNKLEIVLPRFDNDSKALSYDTNLKELASSFGGYTLIEQQGGWVDNGRLYTDVSDRLILNFSELDYTQLSHINLLLSSLWFQGGQLAVFIQINETAYIAEKLDITELLVELKKFKGGR